ncbi:MAG: TetR/AcrR family transcriptional regulator [Clostridia bacterium]|nr:TetR/AcrR family transcriptional regulator [Clostridia bacterium]
MNSTKRRIFNTAVKIFSDKGYDNSSIEEITAVAGVAKGSLYYHFSKKEDIFDLLLEQGFGLLKNNIELKTKHCKDAIEKIEAVLLIQIKVTVKYEEFLNVVFSQIWGEEEKNKKCKKAVFEYIKIIERILKEGIEKGEIYDGNVEALASGIFGTTCSSLIYRLKRNREVDVKEIYDGFKNTVVSALDARKK